MNSTAAPDAILLPTLVSASAGSGKTYSLALRFLQLINLGAPPQSILATTFTKKAAGEILERILRLLCEAALSEEKAGVLGNNLGASDFSPRRASELLALLVRDLHSVRVGTLDSFAVNLVRQFGFELGLLPGWTILDPAEERVLHRRAIRAVLQGDDPRLLVELLRLAKRGRAARSIFGALEGFLQTLASSLGSASYQEWSWLKRWCKDRERPSGAEVIQRLTTAAVPVGKSGRPDKRFEDGVRLLARLVESEEWENIIGSGLVQAAYTGKGTYYKVEIPESLGKVLLDIADRAAFELLTALHHQNQATFALVQRFLEARTHCYRLASAATFAEVKDRVARAGDMLGSEDLFFRLDTRFRHLLLDEFQDTAPAEWRLLEPLAEEILAAPGVERSFFCVGDVKQSIYGWRGSVSTLFQQLTIRWPQIRREERAQSYRSSPAVIETVNRVFSTLHENAALEEFAETARRWQKGFAEHRTVHSGRSGYVRLAAVDDSENERAALEAAASVVESIRSVSPHFTIGVLFRTNGDVSDAVSFFAGRGIRASQEGGTPITDSLAVQYLLSVLTLIDHPGDSIARLHVDLFPRCREAIADRAPLDSLPQLRRVLLRDGLGILVQQLVQPLLDEVSAFDRARLMHLAHLAFLFERRETAVRIAPFLTFVQEKRLESGISAPVRVMTIHQSKGLEFDAVVLPALDVLLKGSRPAVALADGLGIPGQRTRATCYPSEPFRLLCPDLQELHNEYLSQQVEEHLNLLYVALTRPKRALYLFVSQSDRDLSKRRQPSFARVVVGALADGEAGMSDCLYECGDPEWFRSERAALENLSPDADGSVPVPIHTVLARGTGAPVRWRPRRVLSDASVNDDLPFESTSRARRRHAREIVVAALLARLTWIDDIDVDEFLRRDTHPDLVADARLWDEASAAVLSAIALPEIRALFGRSRYGGKKEAVTLCTAIPFQALRAGRELVSGTLDRLIVVQDGTKPVRAEVVYWIEDTLSAQRKGERTDTSTTASVLKDAASRLIGLEAAKIACLGAGLVSGEVVEEAV